MRWNWQQQDWPNFTWDGGRLSKAEHLFLVGGGVLLGSMNHLAIEDQSQLVVELMSAEALTTSEIEGEILDRASVQSSIRRQLGLATDERRIKPGEQGIAEMMVNLYQTWDSPLSHEDLFNWHRMVTSGRYDLKDRARYRTGAEAMQVVSGSLVSPTVHFEAPPSPMVASEMSRFLNWFNETIAQSECSLPALTRAGIAHLYFVSIHPFEDGNGRIGRAISEKSLAQSLGQPLIVSLAPTILARRSSYYDVLETSNKRNEVTSWLAWFAGIAIEAQRRTLSQIEFVIGKAKLLERLAGAINPRQHKVLMRLFREGPEGFRGGLSASNYRTITGASPATATRDLADLADKGAVMRTGDQKYARYHLNVPSKPVGSVVIREDGEVLETY